MLGYKQHQLYDRELRNGIFRHDAYVKSNILLIGAGGLGSSLGYSIVKKGVGELTICDGDTVDITNLHRQGFRYSDIGKHKASALANNLKKEALVRSTFVAIDLYFEEALEMKIIKKPSLCICAPDNDEVRYLAAEYCYTHKVPFITMGLSRDADHGYIFIQNYIEDIGCWHCFKKGNKGRLQCGVASNINLPMLMSSFAITGCDYLLSGIELPWTYRRISLSGKLPELITRVPKWDCCPMCS